MSREHLQILSVRVLSVLVFSSFFSSSPLPRAAGQDSEGGGGGYDLATQLILSRYSNLTPVFRDELLKKFGFCIIDVDEDLNGAFNFSKDSRFVTNCAKKMAGGTIGEVMGRLCTAAEMRMYAEGLFQTQKTTYLKPNKNCNLTVWISGCEPGWACASAEEVDLENRTYVPVRTNECQPCCEGFFCPHGLTCMLPCPMGAYCPLAKLNNGSGICEPYSYQIPPGKRNHTCGGADKWADVVSSREVFCTGGSYCPSTIRKIPCSNTFAGKVPQLRKRKLNERPREVSSWRERKSVWSLVTVVWCGQIQRRRIERRRKIERIRDERAEESRLESKVRLFPDGDL